MGRLHCHVSRCVISRALQFRPMRANQHIGAVCSRSTSLLHTWSDQGSHCSRRAVPLCQLITGEQVPAGRPSTPAAPGGTHPRPVPALPACAHALACTEWPSWYSHLPAATHHHHSGSGVCCCARQTSHQPLADLSGSLPLKHPGQSLPAPHRLHPYAALQHTGICIAACKPANMQLLQQCCHTYGPLACCLPGC
jgi:hypothetical protein